jgi:hypothetical protein
MKKTPYIFCILLIAVLVSSCFTTLTDEAVNLSKNGSQFENDSNLEKGKLTITWGNSQAARAFVSESDLVGYKYEIVLTGPGGRRIEESFEGKESVIQKEFKVVTGNWTITVKGGDANQSANTGIILKVMGIEQVPVKAGKNSTQIIRMYTATEVYNWLELNNAVEKNDENEEAADRIEIIVLKNNFDFQCDPENSFNGTILIKRQIILMSETDVTIGRTMCSQPPVEFPPFFNVCSGGTLTLGKNSMKGTLTFDNGEDNPSESLFIISNIRDKDGYVGGKLEMNDGVTIKNARPIDGGGVYVKSGASFTMNGGTISGNVVRRPGMGGLKTGGGVYVEVGGNFTHNGGDVYDNTPENVYYHQERDYIIAERYRPENATWEGNILNTDDNETITLGNNSISNSNNNNNIYSVASSPDDENDIDYYEDINGTAENVTIHTIGKWAYLGLPPIYRTAC